MLVECVYSVWNFFHGYRSVMCDGRGHLSQHLLQHPSHNKLYSYKLERLVSVRAYDRDPNSHSKCISLTNFCLASELLHAKFSKLHPYSFCKLPYITVYYPYTYVYYKSHAIWWKITHFKAGLSLFLAKIGWSLWHEGPLQQSCPDELYICHM